MSAVVAVIDANVLYRSTVRDLLIRLAISGLIQAKWSDRILDETFHNLVKNRPDLDPAKLARTRMLMNKAVRDVLVDGYEAIEATLTLPDVDDKHVLAAAIKANADIIITDNVSDFPTETLSSWGIVARTADRFISDLIGSNRDAVETALRQIAEAHASPPTTFEGVIDRLEAEGLKRATALLRRQPTIAPPRSGWHQA